MLNSDWISDSHIDFELKKYTLLAYLQKIDKRFKKNKLYPSFSHLLGHQNELLALRESKEQLSSEFRREIDKVNMKKLELTYRKLVTDNDIMQQLDAIIEYSLPRFEKYIETGKCIYEFIKEQLKIFPVGVVPLYLSEGYLFLRNADQKTTGIYRYQMNLVENTDKSVANITVNYLVSNNVSISNTFEKIKSKLITDFPDWPNPATYVIESGVEFPVREAFLPVAKNLLVKYISSTT